MEIIFGLLGLFLGFLGIGLAIYFYFEQRKSQEIFEQSVSSFFNSLEKFNNKTYQLFVDGRIDTIRQMKSIEAENEGYWHFVYRFETCSNIGLVLNSGKQVMVRILGLTDDNGSARKKGNLTYYICKVQEDCKEAGLTKNELIGCFFYGDKKFFSKKMGPVIEPDEKTEFRFGSLGMPMFGSGGDIEIKEEHIKKRMIDYFSNV